MTWGGGITGVTGAVSAANSLVGTTAGDSVGGFGVTALSNGNYVVRTYGWDNGAAHTAGAVTWGNGTIGVRGAISASNSLVGTKTYQMVGGGGVTVLSNGNYVVLSPSWNNSAGAVTWGSGITGAVSAANSLVGTTADDGVGSNGVTVLSNGNYVVNSPSWDNGAATDAGAVTWGNGTTGVNGAVSAANSLVGSNAGDNVGSNNIGSTGVTALSNGNYVVCSPNWDNGAATDAGAVTWGNGTDGTKGAVSAANSLVGSTADDLVGYDGRVAVRSNGNYVVTSAFWDNGAAINAGAVTWGNGTSGVTGAVSAANSLVCTTEDDLVGYPSMTVLSNGNYVVNSFHWDNGAAGDAGAVTWGSGITGVTGAVSAANSLVGSTVSDVVGRVTVLSNGNYVVTSPYWDSDVAPEAGAVTWVNGATGLTGTVSAANSAVGLSANTNLQYEAVVTDDVNNTVFGRFLNEGGGRVRVGSQTTGFPSTPVIGGAVASQAVNDDATIAPFSTLTVTDVDSQDLFVRVTIVNGVVRGDFTAGSTVGWTRTVVGNNIVYHRYYAPQANVATTVQMAVRGFVFQPRSNTIPPGMTETTAFTVYATDGTLSATNSTTTVISTSMNDVPTISGAVANQAVNDNATKAVFSTLTVTDPDTNPMSASVTILNGVVRGDFTPATTTGWTRTVSGNDIRYARTYTSAANIGATVQAAVRAFVFQPRQNAIKPNTTETTVLTVTVTDGIASPVSNNTTSVITTSVNNAPTFGGTTANVAVNDNATVNPFTALTVSDVDTQEILISVTIRNGVVRGDFTPASTVGWATRYTTGNDITYKRYFSPQANVGAAAQAAFRALVFQPRQNAINPGATEATDFLVTVSDGVAPAVLGTGTRVTTTSVNNAPTIGGAVAGQIMNDDQTKAVFSMLTVTDPDTQAMNVIITIPNGVNRGDFTAGSTTGWTRTVVGVDLRYNRFFNATANIGATVQTAIRAIVFQPRTNVPIGTTETTGFTVLVNDGLANTTNSTTSVITTGVAPRVASSQSAVAASFLDSDIKTVIVPTVSKPKSNPLARLLKRAR